MAISLSGIVSLYCDEPKKPSKFGSVSGSVNQRCCIGPNLERGQLEVVGGSTATDGCQSEHGQECLHLLKESAVSVRVTS